MIAEQQKADIPKRTQSFWKIAGPGAVLVGLSIGAGEIIIWPRIVAEFGANMAWAAVLGIFLQLWINMEIGRWTIATGETPFMGFSRIWIGFGPLFILYAISIFLRTSLNQRYQNNPAQLIQTNHIQIRL